MTNKKKEKIKKYWPLFTLLLPALIYTIIFCYGPMYGIIIAFKDFKPKLGYWGSDWVGLEHFKRFLSYPDFWKMIGNTLSISLYSLATFPCAIVLALLLNEVNMQASNVISTYTYQVGLLGGQFSYSTAIGLFNTVVNVIMLLLANTICKKVSGTGIW